jgi:hypothetical protein
VPTQAILAYLTSACAGADRQYGRDNPWVLVNIFGQFPPSSLNALIGPDEVREAQKRFYHEYELKRDGSRSGRSTTPNAFLA